MKSSEMKGGAMALHDTFARRRHNKCVFKEKTSPHTIIKSLYDGHSFTVRKRSVIYFYKRFQTIAKISVLFQE